ncbi:hypothetical protein ABZX92_28680 [Lentzea sp. NPDC006480]|uniref:hypothetical protein n=1 Tax=Lentzea sp. NPDC006480 TaxID=3157176 RepID=UPI0033AFBD62
MRTLIALAAITVISGCTAAMQEDRPPDYTAPSKLVSCAADLPQQWQDELARNQTEAGSHERITIVGADENGDKTLVRTKRNRTTELVLRDHGQRQQVMAVQDQEQISGVEFDGRWVTFSTTVDETSTTYAWDARNDGAPVQIGRNGAVVHNGKAAWSDGKSVHVYDLAKKKDKVVGQGTAPAFFGDTVVWLQNGKLVSETALPEPLNKVRPSGNVASDGRTLVWTEGEDSLHGWRTDWTQPRELAEIKPVPRTEGIMAPRVSGDFVSWRSESGYVTDIRTGATMHTTEGAYLLEVHGGTLTRAGGQVAASAPLTSLTPLPDC